MTSIPANIGQPDENSNFATDGRASLATRDLGRPSSRARWVGRALSGLAVAFLAFDAAIKVAKLAPAVKATTELGYPATIIRGIGMVEILLLAVYLFPRSAVVGAVLWTGYLGGAVASHVRLESPLMTHVAFPFYVAALLWGGLHLRDGRIGALLRK